MREIIDGFFKMDADEVLDAFAAPPGAIVGDGYVFVPGTSPDAVLLVAHADTVYDVPPKNVSWRGNIATAGWGNGCRIADPKAKSGYVYLDSGLGADDRAGCALLWTLRESGHSLLVTDGEEVGCIGAAQAADEIPDLLSRHRFAVQMDRRGDMEFVFYDCATPEFRRFVQRRAGKSWRQEQGSISDISVLCPSVGICGVNVAAGYMHEHTSSEIFFYDAWRRSRKMVLRLIAGSEAFSLPVRKYVPSKGYMAALGWDDDPNWQRYMKDTDPFGYANEVGAAGEEDSDDPWADHDDDNIEMDDGQGGIVILNRAGDAIDWRPSKEDG